MSNKYQVIAAKLYSKLYRKNFYSSSTSNQRQWEGAVKDLINETGLE